MAILRYKGDVRNGLPKVLGGRFLVQGSTYDAERNQTLVDVVMLQNPLKAAGLT